MDQSIFRIQKDKENPYVMVNKGFLNNKELSLKSKGLLTYLLSLPDNWKIYESEIVNHHKDGKDSLKGAIKELIDNGYIERERIRNSAGHLKGYNYCVHEVSTKSGKSVLGLSVLGLSATTNNNLTNNKNNKKRVYINLPVDGHLFFNIYERYFFNKFGKAHMKITTDQLDDVEAKLGELISYDIDSVRFEEEVRDHFHTLPKSNNGNIIAFLTASRRYFDVDTTEYR
jgi:DNA-binding Lrp family transcriptional regulator